VIKVSAPDHRSVIVAAGRATDLRAGIVAAQVPPEMKRLGPIFRALLRPIGWSAMDPADRIVDARSVTVGIARLLAAGIREVVLAQSGWVHDRLVPGLVGSLEHAGITLIVIAHSTWTQTAYHRFDPWLTAEWDWSTFQRWLDGRRAARMGTAHPFLETTARPQRGIPGPARRLELRSVGADVPGEVLDELRTGLTAAATRAEAAAVVASALGRWKDGLDAFLPAAVAALDDRGLRLVAAAARSLPSASAWRDLRGVPDSTAAAALALSSLGLSADEMIRLRIDSVSLDARAVATGDRTLVVPDAARPFVLAQCYMRAAESGWGHKPLLTVEGGHGCDRRSAQRMVVAAEAHLGWHLDARSLDDLGDGDRCLRAFGLAVEGEPCAVYELETLDPLEERRCRHGLPWAVSTDGHVLSHSQLMCRAGAVEDTRRWAAGYHFTPIANTTAACAWAVSQAGHAAGTVWSVASPLGEIWLQSMEANLPSIERVATVVRDVQRRRSFASGHRRRRQMTARQQSGDSLSGATALADRSSRM